MSKKFIYYPDRHDPAFYEKITKKKEFYLYRQKSFKGDKDKICQPKREGTAFKLLPQQQLLKNLMSPNSPYKNLLIVHGTGSGKCVHSETKISILDGFSLNSSFEVSIEEIWKKYKTTIIFDNNGGHWSKPKKDIYVKSIDENINTIICGKVKNLYRQKINETMNMLKLANGNDIIITKIHHLLGNNGWTNNFELNQDIKGIVKKNNEIISSKILFLYEFHYNGYVYDLEIEKYHNYIGNNIICHNTCTAIQIGESFKKYLVRINERVNKELIDLRNKPTIYVIGNDAAQNNFRDELLGLCAGNIYITKDESNQLEELRKDPSDASVELYKKKLREYHKRLTTRSRGGFYRFLGYRDFQNRTIGEKMKIDGRPIRDSTTGKWRRKIKEPSIKTVDNCLIIVDEAHNLVNSSEPNDYAKAIINIYKKSKNVRLILLTATPITHRPKEIIEMLNIIRLDQNDPPMKARDYIKKNNLLPGAEKLIATKSRGYISYLRGYNIYTYPEKINMGVLPKKQGFKYTKLVLCPMSPFHYRTYKDVYHGKIQKHEWNLLNMVFPNPNNSKIGIYRNSEISNLVNTPVNFKKKYGIKFVTLPSGDRQISGPILRKNNIKKYSDKFYTLLNNIDGAVNANNGHIFVYSKIVEGTGTRLLKQILLMNGYIEYSYGTYTDTKELNSSMYNDVICYYCGVTGKRHRAYINSLRSRKKKPGEKIHQYYPARFIIFDRDTENRIIKNIIDEFNSESNVDGHIIKIVVGSPKTREAMDFKRVNYIHIVTYHDNFATIDQIIGRGARHCSHADLAENKRYVKIYRYVSSLPVSVPKNILSYEEERYLEGEKYHIVIKKIERILKSTAIDCALNKPANIFPEEVKKYKDCETKKNHIKCSPLCDYTNCDYKCQYELPSKSPLKFSDLDTTTYDIYYYYQEQRKLKKYIKKLFRKNIVWTLDDIIYNIFHTNPIQYRTSNIKRKYLIKDPKIKHLIPNAIAINKYYSDESTISLDISLTKDRDKMNYIDIKYIYLALNELTTTKQKVKNYFGNEGYIIERGPYYVFQPLDAINDTLPLAQRNTPLFKYDQTEINVDTYIKKYYSSIDEIQKKMDYIEVKNKIMDIPIHKYSLISKLIGKLNFNNQLMLLENAIEISQYSSKKISKKNKEYTRKIFRFFQNYLIDNSKFSGRYDYKRSREIVDEIYDDPHRKIIGHVLTPDPRCYIGGKWIACIYELFGKSRRDVIKKYKNNNFIIGYVDKTKHGKMVFKLKYTNPDVIMSKDKRRIFKGFICNQHSNKKELLNIASELGIDKLDKKSTIYHICSNIETKLRENEINERHNKSNVKWFYEYIELVNRENRSQSKTNV